MEANTISTKRVVLIAVGVILCLLIASLTGILLYQHYSTPTLPTPRETQSSSPQSEIDRKYVSLPNAEEILGSPTDFEQPTTDGAGTYRDFQYGAIYWTPQTGAYEVHGAIYKEWASLGLERGYLGYPTSDETMEDIKRYNHFQHGSIYWSPELGAHEIYDGT